MYLLSSVMCVADLPTCRSPSSPVSVGMTPSNRTLEVGSVQVDITPVLVTLEQFPAADDPLTS